MRNARLDEAQAGIKIARRNINNLRYADDTSLIAESEEELREKTMAPHSSILAWKIPWMEEPGRLQSMGLLRVRRDWTTSLWFFTFMHWRRKWQPTPLFLPGESQGWGSLVGCRLGVAQHWTRLKWLRSSSRRRTKEPVDKSERGQWKSWLKTQHSENSGHGIWSHLFVANRWGNSGNSDWLLFFCAPKSLQMVTVVMN